MRRKNRQIKMKIDLPDEYDSDEDFMVDFRDTLDEFGWAMVIVNEAKEEIDLPINSITLGEVEIEPEDEE